MGIFEFLFGSPVKSEELIPVPDPAEISLQKLSLAYTEIDAKDLPSYLKFRVNLIFAALDKLLTKATSSDKESLIGTEPNIDLPVESIPISETDSINLVFKTENQEISCAQLLESFSHAEIDIHDFLAIILDYLEKKIQRYQKLPKDWVNSRPIENGDTPLLILINKLDFLAYSLSLLTQEEGNIKENFYVAEIWIDPQWYAKLDPEEGLPKLNEPRIIPLFTDSLEIGRVSDHPVIDCGNDLGVSRKHAKLQFVDGSWEITDLGSRNGTYLGLITSDLPNKVITGTQKINHFSRIYLGSWTRLVIRPARSEEMAENRK